MLNVSDADREATCAGIDIYKIFLHASCIRNLDTGRYLAIRMSLGRKTLVASHELDRTHRDAIVDLMVAYSWALDTGNGEALAALFTPEGKFCGADGSVTQGADDLLRFSDRVFESRPYHLQHIASNHQFSAVSTSVVEVRSYVHIYTGSADGPELLGMGRYRDTVEHTSNGWRFKERQFESLGRNKRAATQELGG